MIGSIPYPLLIVCWKEHYMNWAKLQKMYAHIYRQWEKQRERESWQTILYSTTITSQHHPKLGKSSNFEAPQFLKSQWMGFTHLGAPTAPCRPCVRAPETPWRPASRRSSRPSRRSLGRRNHWKIVGTSGDMCHFSEIWFEHMKKLRKMVESWFAGVKVRKTFGKSWCSKLYKSLHLWPKGW